MSFQKAELGSEERKLQKGREFCPRRGNRFPDLSAVQSQSEALWETGPPAPAGVAADSGWERLSTHWIKGGDLQVPLRLMAERGDSSHSPCTQYRSGLPTIKVTVKNVSRPGSPELGLASVELRGAASPSSASPIVRYLKFSARSWESTFLSEIAHIYFKF